ncbi:MAG: trypsin-like peptidase domain-containing protein [Anaerolineae bacterium]
MRNPKYLVLSLVIAAIAFAAGGAVTSVTAQYAAHPAFYTAPVVAQDSQTVTFEDEGQLFAQLYDTISPSVVSINVTATRSGSASSGGGVVYGTGSGFVVDTDGHIVTNNHVVQGATDIEVNFYDGTIVRGEVIGEDPNSDLAVIKVDLPAEELHPVTFADSDALDIGETVLAIGSPFGQRWTLTSGIVSALDRTIVGLTDFSIGGVIQTDASINPGNSGGPLLDLQGNVIGVNSQIETESGSNSGVGFAIPSNLVQRVARALIDHGEVSYSYLGIQGGDISLQIIEALNLPNNQRGVVVSEVQRNSPAEDGGLQNAVVESSTRTNSGVHRIMSADIITAIDGVQITGMGQLITYLANNTQPGQQVVLTVLRDGQSIDLTITLSARPGSGQVG